MMIGTLNQRTTTGDLRQYNPAAIFTLQQTGRGAGFEVITVSFGTVQAKCRGRAQQ
jgi:hypothetical protein